MWNGEYMQLYELYLITNKVNNKKYVGQTMSRKGYMERWKEHVDESKYSSRQSCILHKAISKYGKESFNIKRLLKDIPEKDIDRLEQRFIERYNTFYEYGQGYNMTLGGQGVHGYKHTEETKARISKTNQNRPFFWTPEKIAQRSETCKRNHTFEKRKEKGVWQRKLSEIAIARFKNEPGTFKGKHHSDRTKQMISEANTGKKRTGQVRLAYVIQRGNPVGMYDLQTNELIMKFEALSLARDYLIKKGYTKSEYATDNLRHACNKPDTRTAYGFRWKFIHSVSTNPDECKDVD